MALPTPLVTSRAPLPTVFVTSMAPFPTVFVTPIAPMPIFFVAPTAPFVTPLVTSIAPLPTVLVAPIAPLPTVLVAPIAPLVAPMAPLATDFPTALVASTLTLAPLPTVLPTVLVAPTAPPKAVSTTILSKAPMSFCCDLRFRARRSSRLPLFLGPLLCEPGLSGEASKPMVFFMRLFKTSNLLLAFFFFDFRFDPGASTSFSDFCFLSLGTRRLFLLVRGLLALETEITSSSSAGRSLALSICMTDMAFRSFVDVFFTRPVLLLRLRFLSLSFLFFLDLIATSSSIAPTLLLRLRLPSLLDFFPSPPVADFVGATSSAVLLSPSSTRNRCDADSAFCNLLFRDLPFRLDGVEGVDGVEGASRYLPRACRVTAGDSVCSGMGGISATSLRVFLGVCGVLLALNALDFAMAMGFVNTISMTFEY
mmetsp:Transcript_43775/g.105587  ORF Transcript_43775/g.105587 Transcript_43775/m.105587 type:complete len:423 (-) Transcript_43775:995-2263(-)